MSHATSQFCHMTHLGYLVWAVWVPRKPLPGWRSLTVCIVLLPAVLQYRCSVSAFAASTFLGTMHSCMWDPHVHIVQWQKCAASNNIGLSCCCCCCVCCCLFADICSRFIQLNKQAEFRKILAVQMLMYITHKTTTAASEGDEHMLQQVTMKAGLKIKQLQAPCLVSAAMMEVDLLHLAPANHKKRHFPQNIFSGIFSIEQHATTHLYQVVTCIIDGLKRLLRLCVCSAGKCVSQESDSRHHELG